MELIWRMPIQTDLATKENQIQQDNWKLEKKITFDSLTNNQCLTMQNAMLVECTQEIVSDIL